MTPYTAGVVPSVSRSVEAQIVGSSVVFKESGDVMRRCRAQLRRLKVIDALLPAPKPKLKPQKAKFLKVSTTPRPTGSTDTSHIKNTGSKSAPKDDADEDDSKVNGAKNEANTDEAKPDANAPWRKLGGGPGGSVRSALRQQKRNALMVQAEHLNPTSADATDRSFSDMRASILTRTVVGHTGKMIAGREPGDAAMAERSQPTDGHPQLGAPLELPSSPPKKNKGSVLFEDNVSSLSIGKANQLTMEALRDPPTDEESRSRTSSVEMKQRRRSSIEEVEEVPGAYMDMMKGKVVEAPAFFDSPHEVDEVSQELSQKLDIHISTVDHVRAIFADAAQGQDYLDEKQFKEATLQILHAQESEVPRYRLQGFYQEAMACAPIFTPASAANRKVTVDKFVVWYRKNFYGGDIRDPGDRSAAEVFYQMKMSGHRGTILQRSITSKR